jgi:rhamnogalacturonan endolyase
MKIGRLSLVSGAALAILATISATPSLGAPRVMERLDRGVVAAPAKDGGVLVSWRLLATDAAKTGFDVYRGGRKLNAAPITDSTNYVDRAGGAGDYSVRVTGKPAEAGATAAVLTRGYLSIPLQKPQGGVSLGGEAYTYSANDTSVGDLDGDGDYEIVVKWDPSNAQDNSRPGYTGNVIFDAYTLEGKRLWRIDMGHNVRAGAHYTQFLVYDFDGDGRAEFVARTSDGAVDGQGGVIGDAAADWRSKDAADQNGRFLGRIMKGPEYLTVFDGLTGKALASAPYVPARDPSGNDPTGEQMTATWGDNNANRADRFLAGVAYLDGVHPSIVMARGYYTRTTLAAWDWRGGKLTERWLFDSAQPGLEAYSGQGNHQLSVADVDGDGRDEIVYGSMAVDDNGKGLWTSGLFHGDAMHVSDLDPTHPGLEKFGVHESPTKNGGIIMSMLDARTGARLWTVSGEGDNGRGVAIDIDPAHPGTETWSSGVPALYSAQGKVIAPTHPRQINFAIWWDGDLLRELLDRNEISKWDPATARTTALLTAEGAASNNGTKSNPALSGDILGDWREELLLRSEDSAELRLYVTPYVTTHRLTTLMQDPQYRLAIAWQNVAYNQPPHPGFFLGAGMSAPRKPDITVD